MKRKLRRSFHEVGHAHCFTFNCFHGRPFLTSDRIRGWLADAIVQARTEHSLDLWAYVFMPEHVHLLFFPTDPEFRTAAVLQSIKQPVTQRAVAWLKANNPAGLSQLLDAQPNGAVSYRIWQRGGGHDRNLYSPAAIHAEIAYLHANPLRRELCERPDDWYWSSAADFAGRKDGPIPIDFDSIPKLIV